MTVVPSRRQILRFSAMLMAGMSAGALRAAGDRKVMARVIIDNDFAGDPDGLFQLAHHLLSRSVDIPLIVASHLPVKFGGPASATGGAGQVRDLLKVMGLDGQYGVVAGAERSLASRTNPAPTLATAAIIKEAMREGASAPLFYAAGASLTELAMAWVAEPRIGRRLKLVWIGGREHGELAYAPPGKDEAEFNFGIDPLAAQIIFNESDIEIWQVPRDAYRQMLFSHAEMADLAASSKVARYLLQKMDGMAEAIAKIPGLSAMGAAETYILGDSPLVTLTALMSPIEPDPSSSRYVHMPTPRIDADGRYQTMTSERPMRVYTAIDSGLTIRDMIAKFKASGT